ncbi:MAG: EAL domain-containing protein [Solirubrobacterales bacterium]|nr:EAL domain-containing protein [Solirubrobacterales bacterium]
MLAKSAQAAPTRVLLLSGDLRTARLIEDQLHAAWSAVELITHPIWAAPAAKALLDHPLSCVLLDLASADALTLLEDMRMSAPDTPIVALLPRPDERLVLRAIRDGAEDCMVTDQLEPAALRRTLRRAIERKRAETRLVHQALHDQLTGLPNRALFLDRLGGALERSRRSGAGLAVLFLDFDDFKQINDSRGHAAGDKLLATLARRLSGLLRPTDMVARFGGDEFTLLFEGLTSEREVVLIADRICQAAALPVDVGGVEIRITASIGIAMVADPSATPETIIREADAAMYRAKARGRSRYELFGEESRRRALERLELEAALRRAVEQCEMCVHYQPYLLLRGPMEPAGIEALVRWQHPTRGLIAAQEFMPLANDIGLADPIGRFVFEHALAQLARCRARKPNMTISLNISSPQLQEASLPSVLSEAMNAAGLEPAAVCLDVAERELAEDPDAAITALARLKSSGVRIALDDFGSGGYPLSRLRELPIDALKIDQRFIAGVGASPEDTSMAGAIVDLGHALGLVVVAEGVETEAQLEQLRELGCDVAQGYAIGRPVSEEQLDALLTAQDAATRDPDPHARRVNPLPRTVLISAGEPSLRRNRVT